MAHLGYPQLAQTQSWELTKKHARLLRSTVVDIGLDVKNIVRVRQTAMSVWHIRNVTARYLTGVTLLRVSHSCDVRTPLLPYSRAYLSRLESG